MEVIRENNNVFGDDIAFIKEYDFSKANSSHQARLEAVTSVASICYASPDKIGSQGLYDRLANEDIGIPSSAFAFIPVLMDEVQRDRFENEDTECYTCKYDTTTFGETIEHNGVKYLLTNLRALLQDLGWTTDYKKAEKLSEKYFNTSEEDIEIIKKYYKIYKVKIDMASSKQWIRHWFHLQELCISGDSIIKTSQGNRKISEMYRIQEANKGNTYYKYPKVKSYDFKSKTFFMADVKEVFFTGEKEVFEVNIQYGSKGYVHKIKATKDHKFLTKDGWSTLENLTINDFIAINGIPLYQDKEWLAQQKQFFLEQGIGMKQMAIELGINYNTLKKWIHKHRLQYTPMEVASTFNVWNKGVRGEDSHSFGKVLSIETREKISEAHLMKLGETKQGYGKRLRSHWEADFRRKKILERDAYKCTQCGSFDNLELDHKYPVFSHPELGLDEGNIQVLCKDCHLSKSQNEAILSRQTINYGMVVSITKVGVEKTYDMEIDHIDHNYVANSIVVHNSRRYVSGKKVPFDFYIDEKMQKVTSVNDIIEYTGNYTTQEVIDICMNHYYAALEQGVKPQDARRIIPQGAYTEIWTGMMPRVLDNMLKLRTKPKTQWEFRQLALQIAEWEGWIEN